MHDKAQAPLVTAHLLAIERADRIGFGRFIISATTPVTRDDLAELRRVAPAVVRRLFPDVDRLYAARGWRLAPTIGRVYVNELAKNALGWQPKYDVRHALDCFRAGRDLRSPLARQVGPKGYHSTAFAEGPYPVC
jgi:UDP-glucose 4-epimerase